MNVLRVVGIGVVLATVGCGDDPKAADNAAGTGGSAAGESNSDAGSKATAGSDSNGGSGGAAPADDGGMGGQGPAEEVEACGPAASTNADGILTAFPNIQVTMTPASDFAITSFNFVVIEDGDERGPLLKFFADLKNVGTTEGCQFLPEVFLDATEIITLVDGPPKHLKIGDTLFTTVDECISTGQTAVMHGVQRGVTEADLANATSLTIKPSPSNTETSVYLAAIGPTIEDAEIAASGTDYLLKGTAAYASAVHNQGIRVYPRDSRQLLVDELLAFPGDLGNHAAGSTAPFETNATPCHFTTYELFQTWIQD